MPLYTPSPVGYSSKGATVSLPLISRATPFATAFKTSQIRVANLGDSISARCGGVALHMCAQSSGTMRFVYNGGVSSQTSTQILARVQTVLAVKPDVVVIQAGTNDPPASIPTATTLSNIQNMISAVLAAGAIPYLVTLPPRSDTSVMSAISAINDGIQNLALSNGVPIYRAWRSVNDGTNHYISGASSDNIHPYTEILPFEGAAAYTAFVSQMGAILADSMRFDLQGGGAKQVRQWAFPHGQQFRRSC